MRWLLAALIAVVAAVGVIGWSMTRPSPLQAAPAQPAAGPVGAARSQAETLPRSDPAMEPVEPRSKAQADASVAAALALQADRSQTWQAETGILIEAMRGWGQVSDTDWSRYHEQAFAPELRVRPRVRSGDPVPLSLLVNARAGRELPVFRADEASFELDGVARPDAARRGLSFNGDRTWLWIPAEPLPPGPHRLRLALSGAVTVGGSDAPLASRRFVLDAAFTVTPPDESTVRGVIDELKRDRVRRAFGVTAALRTRGADELWYVIEAEPLPVPLAFEVWVEQAGLAFPAGQIASPPRVAEDGKTSFEWSGPPGEIKPGRGRFLLRPSARVAAQTMDLTEYWGEPVAIADVKIVDGRERR